MMLFARADYIYGSTQKCLMLILCLKILAMTFPTAGQRSDIDNAARSDEMDRHPHGFAFD
jgi:hypothetical protein